MAVYCFCSGVGGLTEMDFEFNTRVNIFYKYSLNIHLALSLLVPHNRYGHDRNNLPSETEDWNTQWAKLASVQFIYFFIPPVGNNFTQGGYVSFVSKEQSWFDDAWVR